MPNQTRRSVTVEHKRLEKQHLLTVTTGLIGENYNEREDGSYRVRIYIFINFHTYFNFLKFDMANDMRSSYDEAALRQPILAELEG